MALVEAAAVPTNEMLTGASPLNSLKSRHWSNEFTCPHGGFLPPHLWHVVRPTRMSCLYGTPMIATLPVTRHISLHTSSSLPGGICSRTSAHRTTSNLLSSKSSRLASP